MDQIIIRVDFELRKVFINDVDVTPIKTPEEMVSENGLLLENLEKTQQLCNIAVKQNGAALQFVPKEFQTIDMCVLALEQDKSNIQYVLNNKEFFEAFLKSKMVL